MHGALINRVVAAAIVVSVCASARASFKSLAERVPASANAVVAINAAKVLQSPYAKTEWAASTAAEAWAKQPMMVPPGAQRVLFAAEVQSNLDSLWEMALMHMNAMPSVKAIAEAEGGSIDRVWDKDAVSSPINAYFVPLDGNVLASITPANRSAIAKWVRTPPKPEGNVTSEYIGKVLRKLGDQTDIVMAMDLEGAFGVPRIRRWLDENDIKELKTEQLDEAARILGTMKGIVLEIRVDQDAKGRATVDFDRDATALGESPKSIMIGVLNAAGMGIDDIEQWKFVTVGKQVTAEGKLSTPSLFRLLSVVQSPIPAATVAQPAAGKSKEPATPAEASQRYYKAICAGLDNFKAGTSSSETATWARALAKRIEQLPILNVDPALVQWGSMISTKLKQAGAGLAIGQTQINVRTAGVLDPAYSTTSYDSDGNYQSGISAGDAENARRQRRAAALEQKAQAQQQAMEVVNEIAQTRPAIRQEMVAKYNVEF